LTPRDIELKCRGVIFSQPFDDSFNSNIAEIVPLAFERSVCGGGAFVYLPNTGVDLWTFREEEGKRRDALRMSPSSWFTFEKACVALLLPQLQWRRTAVFCTFSTFFFGAVKQHLGSCGIRLSYLQYLKAVHDFFHQNPSF